MDDTITCMRVHPVEATTIRRPAYILWNGFRLAIDVDCTVYVNVIGILSCITGYIVYGWVGCIVDWVSLDMQEGKSHYNE